jgi:four helix bundle protein
MAERGFEGLDCYQLALQVFREAYAVAAKLPAIERYNLADQLRRAATSVTLNIAEGYGRYHYLDKIRFYYIARGSLTETQAAFVDCQIAGYIPEEELTRLRSLCARALQSLNGFIRYTHGQRQGKKEFGDRVLSESEAEYTTAPYPTDEFADFPNPEFPDAESTNNESTNNGG